MARDHLPGQNACLLKRTQPRCGIRRAVKRFGVSPVHEAVSDRVSVAVSWCCVLLLSESRDQPPCYPRINRRRETARLGNTGHSCARPNLLPGGSDLSSSPQPDWIAGDQPTALRRRRTGAMFTYIAATGVLICCLLIGCGSGSDTARTTTTVQTVQDVTTKTRTTTKEGAPEAQCKRFRELATKMTNAFAELSALLSDPYLIANDLVLSTPDEVAALNQRIDDLERKLGPAWTRAQSSAAAVAKPAPEAACE